MLSLGRGTWREPDLGVGVGVGVDIGVAVLVPLETAIAWRRGDPSPATGRWPIRTRGSSASALASRLFASSFPSACWRRILLVDVDVLLQSLELPSE